MKLIKYWLNRMTLCKGYCTQKLFFSKCLGCPVGQGIEMHGCEKKMKLIYDKYSKRLGFDW